MPIIQQLFEYINFAVVAAILCVIALMLVRLVMQYADLNPFGRPVMFVRRITDPIVAPVRGGLRNAGINPDVAPFITILLAILFGWFVTQLGGSLEATIRNVSNSIAKGAPVQLIGSLLYGAVDIYSVLFFIYIIMSWVTNRYTNPVTRFLARVCEPVLTPLRRLIPPLGPFDLSPLILFLVIFPLLKAAIAGTLLR